MCENTIKKLIKSDNRTNVCYNSFYTPAAKVLSDRNGGRKQTQKQKGGERMEQITIILREWSWSIALFIILATGLAGMIKLLISIVKNSLS